MSLPNQRSEKEIFSELELLCSSPGYIYALALMCYKNNFIKFNKKFSFEDGEKYYLQQDLVRNELSLLTTLTMKSGANSTHITNKEAKILIKRTNQLLEDLHSSMLKKYTDKLSETLKKNPEKLEELSPFRSPIMLREAVFYHQEVAYSFQYQEFSKDKYMKDNKWLINNKGFNSIDADIIVQSIYHLQCYNATILSSQKNIQKEPTYSLDVFELDVDSLVSDSSLSKDVVVAFLNSFSLFNNLQKELESFKRIDDFNPYNSCPIIQLNSRYYCLNIYNISEAIYDTPYYWFLADKSYKSIASKNHGDFTELFIFNKLLPIFSQANIYKNVNIYKKGTKRIEICEIDILVIFGKRVLVIQAKSKKLTLKSKQGNIDSITQDFTKSFQEAYDQALTCSECLLTEDFDFYDSDDQLVPITFDYLEIYPICLTSANYPTYTFQSKDLLKYKETKRIMPPFVTDIFCLEIMTEFLATPLYFLSYLNRRVKLNKKIISSNEYNILGFHLENNLWFSNDHDTIVIDDNYCISIDTAMYVRNKQMLGEDTPKGLLTLFKGTLYDNILKQLSSANSLAAIELGFLLLTLSSDTIKDFITLITELCCINIKENKSKGAVLGITDNTSKLETMIVVRCSNQGTNADKEMLEHHCSIQKYRHKLNSVFGILINFNYELIGCHYDNSLWKNDPEFGRIAEKSINSQKYEFKGKSIKSIKQKRNDPCNCGSKKKYKKCCLLKE